MLLVDSVNIYNFPFWFSAGAGSKLVMRWVS
jgi:hypothetical protein